MVVPSGGARCLGLPAAMVVLGGFVAYQLHQWTISGSSVLLALSAFDLVMIALVWREWRGMRAPGATH
ncbi:MAG: hypothetical protein M9957_14800 [Rhodobacteraceae bacterium]|nr:hypothetical protein [Paracoccaceae bacterium]